MVGMDDDRNPLTDLSPELLPQWLLLLLLAIGLPVLYACVCGGRRPRAGYKPDKELHALAARRLAGESTKRVMTAAQIVAVCRNAREYLPYNIQRIYGCGPFFDSSGYDGARDVVLVFQVQGVDGKSADRAPRKAVEAAYLESHVMGNLTADIARDYASPIAALPALLAAAADEENQPPALPRDQLQALYSNWLEGLSWHHCFKDPKKKRRKGAAPSSTPMPWQAGRLTTTLLRRNAGELNLGPLVVEHPDRYRGILYSPSLAFTLVWEYGDTDEMVLARLSSRKPDDKQD